MKRSESLAIALVLAAACGQRIDPALAHRAYIVSHDSDELTVIDLDRMEIAGRVATLGIANHMAELSADLSRIFVDSEETDETVVVDSRKLEVMGRIAVGRHPTHATLSKDGKLLAVVDEDEGVGGAVSFIDPQRNVEVKRLGGFLHPHFVRFAPDGTSAYVANIDGHHLTRLDLRTLVINGAVVLDGFDAATPAPYEGGFADAQIDPRGMLYAAHADTGRLLVYDTVRRAKVAELPVGARPWIAYAEHPFTELPQRALVPNFGDETVSLVDATPAVKGAVTGDHQSYGVNYSPLAPDKAFVMNRMRQDIAVVDTRTATITARIPVGGNTETASTTADGRFIVATVSSANRVVVIDARTNAIVKVFDGVGRYPWSVTIPYGQNYCH
jgi:DNA-binding beta-propeller fold protein YncE